MKERPDLEDVKANAKEVDAHGQPSGEQLALTCKGPSRVDSEGPREAVHNLSVSSRPTSEAAIAPLPSEESVAKKKECRGLAGPVGRYIGNEHMAQDGHERELVCDLASQGSTFEAEGDMVLKSTKLTPKHGFGGSGR